MQVQQNRSRARWWVLAFLTALLPIGGARATPVAPDQSMMTVHVGPDGLPDFTAAATDASQLAQTFAPQITGHLTEARAYVRVLQAANVTAEIRTVDATSNRPRATVLATVTRAIDATGWGWQTFFFSTAAEVSAGSGYALVLSSSGSADAAANTLEWAGYGPDPYPFGAAYRCDEGWWEVSLVNGDIFDGAFQTFVTAAPPSTLDQYQTGASADVYIDAGDGTQLAQTFTAGVSGQLDRVEAEFQVLQVSALTVELRGVDASGVPTDHVLARTSAQFDAPADHQWWVFGFVPSASVRAGTRYALVFTSYEGANPASANVRWTGSTGDPYASGQPYRETGSGWFGPGSDMDAAFQVFVAANRVGPLVSTGGATNVTASGATLAGEVTDAGSGSVYERGVVFLPERWNESPLRSSAGSSDLVASTGGLGAFSVDAVELLGPATEYLYAAYATNGSGTAYGAVGTFLTPPLYTGVKDQEQASLETGSRDLFHGQHLAQTFQAGVSGVLTQVDVALKRFAGRDPIMVDIYDTDPNGGWRGGGAIWRSIVETIPLEAVGMATLQATGSTWVQVPLALAPEVQAGHSYAIVLSAWPGSSYQWGSDYPSATYASGSAWDDVGGTWTERTSDDYMFRTYVARRAPEPALDVNPTVGEAPLTVNFDASASDTSIVSFDWEFGDGETDSGATVQHTYANVGNYTAKLTVTDDTGATGTTEVLIRVLTYDAPPVAVISANPLSGPAPLTVTFTSMSTDPDGMIKSLYWSFPTGKAYENPTTYTFETPGKYTVGLWVRDDRGKTDNTSVTIDVTSANLEPVAIASASPASGDAPLRVRFTGTSSYDPDGTIASWAWDFGDGTTGSGSAVTHAYASKGTYTPTLTVTDNLGATNSAELAAVTVYAAPVASFVAAPASGPAPLTVAFDASSSTADGTFTCAWSFGGKSTATGCNVNHEFTSAGTYTVTLKVTDQRGVTATKTGTVTVNPASMTATVGEYAFRQVKNGLYVGLVSVKVTTGGGSVPVAKAKVIGDWTVNGTVVATSSGFTDANGWVDLSASKLPSSSATLTVRSVTKAGYVYP